MRELGTGALALIVALVLISGVAVWALFFNRHALPYAEETRRLTYGQSLAYQQGSQRDFENLCLQYAQATDPAAKAIIADTIRRRAQDYVGPPLADNVSGCLAKLGAGI